MGAAGDGSVVRQGWLYSLAVCPAHCTRFKNLEATDLLSPSRPGNRGQSHAGILKAENFDTPCAGQRQAARNLSSERRRAHARPEGEVHPRKSRADDAARRAPPSEAWRTDHAGAGNSFVSCAQRALHNHYFACTVCTPTHRRRCTVCTRNRFACTPCTRIK